jgi:hypothetical protein
LCQLSGTTGGLAALLLAGCAAPGGIYMGYEGPPRDVANLAILQWSTHRNQWVTHIDDRFLHEDQSFFGGVAITIAHLQPGRHAITVYNNWGQYLGDSKDVTLQANLEAGNVYDVRVDRCRKCDPFSVDFLIVSSETGAVVEKSTRLSNTTYREIQRQRFEECERECKREGLSCRNIYFTDEQARDRCDDKKASCLFWCDPFSTELFDSILDLFEAD